MIPFIIITANRRDPPHMIFCCLNQDMELGNYPTEVMVGENLSLHFNVKSHWNEPLDIQVRHIIGKNSTVNIGSTGSTNGTLVQNFTRRIEINEEWISDTVNTSFSELLGINEHYLIIFELWADFGLGSGWEFMQDQIVFIRLNATSQQ
ncbi:MAG: hypothetical protein ACTSWY_15540 [Promethearchaeota archaeon]